MFFGDFCLFSVPEIPKIRKKFKKTYRKTNFFGKNIGFPIVFFDFSDFHREAKPKTLPNIVFFVFFGFLGTLSAFWRKRLVLLMFFLIFVWISAVLCSGHTAMRSERNSNDTLQIITSETKRKEH